MYKDFKKECGLNKKKAFKELEIFCDKQSQIHYDEMDKLMENLINKHDFKFLKYLEQSLKISKKQDCLCDHFIFKRDSIELEVSIYLKEKMNELISFQNIEGEDSEKDQELLEKELQVCEDKEKEAGSKRIQKVNECKKSIYESLKLIDKI